MLEPRVNATVSTIVRAVPSLCGAAARGARDLRENKANLGYKHNTISL